MVRHRKILGGLVGLVLALADPVASRSIPEKVSLEHRVWLEEVDLLLSDEEWDFFLSLDKDYQRDGFIRRFWQARDPYPGTERNEFKEAWEGRLGFVRQEYGNLDEDRARLTLLNGEPTDQIEGVCPAFFAPTEIWRYDRSTQYPLEFYLVFVKPIGQGSFRIWYPNDNPFLFLRRPEEARNACAQARRVGRNPVAQARRGQYVEELNCLYEALALHCRYEDQFVFVSRVLDELTRNQVIGFAKLINRIERTPAPHDGEWLLNLAAYSTDLPADAVQLPAELEISYPAARGARTVVQGLIRVPAKGATSQTLGSRTSYNFELIGEILRQGELFESFKYRFDLQQSQTVDGDLPLVFQRALRPGEFTLLLKLEDLHAKRFFRTETALSVPAVDAGLPPDAPGDSETDRLFEEAVRALRGGSARLELVAPKREVLTGMVRFDALHSGDDLAKVTFYLNGKPLLSKRRPPFSVELDVGDIPRSHTLRVVGFDADGTEVTRDELDINTGSHRFSIRLEEPVSGRHYDRSAMVRAEVEIPEGERLEKVELFLNETLVATLFQPPFAQPVLLEESQELTYVRAVAYLSDGNSAEDIVFVNSQGFLDEVNVQLVELYTSVIDGNGRPVTGLEIADFAISEDGAAQRIVRFEVVRDLPIHVTFLLDSSASMEDSLSTARDAVLTFFSDILTAKDRAAVVTFAQRPNLAVSFTDQLDEVAASLASLNAAGGTALWDSLIFTLYYFNGISGQRAILLLSDGDDESSRQTYKQALTYAQTAGVAIYTIGLDLPKGEIEIRHRLKKLAERTGGRSYYVNAASELGPVYAEIERELRSKYLLAYQSSSTRSPNEFRSIEVTVGRQGAKAKTLRGYFP